MTRLVLILLALCAATASAQISIDSTGRGGLPLTVSDRPTIQQVTDTISANVARSAAMLAAIRDSLSANAVRRGMELARIADSASALVSRIRFKGTAAISTGDSVQVTVTGILPTDVVIVTAHNNAQYKTATNQIITSSAVWATNTLTIFAASSKKVTYYVLR